MGRNLSLRGVWEYLEIWSALGAILGLFSAYLRLVVKYNFTHIFLKKIDSFNIS